MSSGDKTFCGQGDHNDIETTIEILQEQFSVSRQDVLNAIQQAGNDRVTLEAFFRNKESVY